MFRYWFLVLFLTPSEQTTHPPPAHGLAVKLSLRAVLDSPIGVAYFELRGVETSYSRNRARQS